MIEDWVAADPAILGLDALVVGRQAPADHGEFIDLLAMDAAGSLVIVQRKKDRTPREIVAQVLDLRGRRTRMVDDRLPARSGCRRGTVRADGQGAVVRVLLRQFRSGRASLLVGHAPLWLRPLRRREFCTKRLPQSTLGDEIFPYDKGNGHIDYGVVTSAARPAAEFETPEGPLFDRRLDEPRFKRTGEPAEHAEHVVGIDWRRTVEITHAERFKGSFANQNIVCRLRDEATVDFLIAKLGVKRRT